MLESFSSINAPRAAELKLDIKPRFLHLSKDENDTPGSNGQLCSAKIIKIMRPAKMAIVVIQRTRMMTRLKAAKI